MVTGKDADLATRRHGSDYIDRKIETVRNHRNADNCWPQWANIFADEIEDLRAELSRLREQRDELAEQGCDGGPYCKASPHIHGCFADKGDCDHPSEHADRQEDKT